MAVTWKQIDGELDGYRAGFVAVFRKYEGEQTDEQDDYGRAVKVTAASFARHLDVSATTFRRWIKNAETGSALSGRTATQASPISRSGQMGRQIAKSPTVSVDDKVGMLNDLVSDKQVMRAYRERRTPVVTPADARAAEAAAAAFAAPIVNAAVGLQVPMWVSQIKGMTKTISECELGDDDYNALRKAVQKLVNELDVQAFRLDLA